jgi:SAM-dependent methyltransferase
MNMQIKEITKKAPKKTAAEKELKPKLTFRQKLFRCYWKLERMMVPGLRSSQYAYYETVQTHLNGRKKWLDLGCGHHIFATWMEDEQAELARRADFMVGLDYDLPSLKKNAVIRNVAVADVCNAPLRSGAFEMITANMVVEHLEDPPRSLTEIRRMLKPGGLFIFHTPNYQNYIIFIASLVPDFIKKKIVHFLEGREEADIFPTHYRLNTPAAIEKVAEQSGFKLVELRVENTSAVIGSLGPLAVFELFIIKLLSYEPLRNFRPDIVAVLQNPE